MVSLGIDVSASKLAFASLGENGEVRHFRHFVLPGIAGARRLAACRLGTTTVIERHFPDACVVIVENPWPGHVLLSIGAVVLEAAQAALPGAVVMDVQAATWKLDSLGNGRASKAAGMEHALALGLLVEDQDCADALCMAQAGWHRWNRDVRESA